MFDHLFFPFTLLVFTMSSATHDVIAEGASLPEKKRRFSLFRGRNSEPTVTVPPEEPSRPGSSGPRTSALSASPMLTEASSSGSQAGSVHSTLSLSSDLSPSVQGTPSLSRVLEGTQMPMKTDDDGLPTYTSVAHPSKFVTYGFIRCSPFAMVLSPEESGMEGSGLYHISVGVNIWMPSMTVTTLRRGASESGPIVASLE